MTVDARDRVLPRDAEGVVEVRKSRVCGGGFGLFATRPLKKLTRLGTYPGRVLRSSEALQTSRHGVHFFRVSSGLIDDDFVVDPELPDGSIAPEFRCAVLCVNEPPVNRRQNAIFVWDLVSGTVDLYTWTAVRRNQEIFVAYGHEYHDRGYEVSARRPAALFARTKNHPVPVPIDEARDLPARAPPLTVSDSRGDDREGCGGVVLPFDDLSIARVAPHPTKGGMGLFAARDLPPWTPIAAYPGRVYHIADFEALHKGGRRAYAVDFFAVRPDMSVRDDVVLDPGHPTDPDRLDPVFEDYLAPRVNEPSPHETPNAVWVRDIPSGLLWLYTYAGGVRAGDEILLLYGDSYEGRTYDISRKTAEHVDDVLFGRPIAVSPAFAYDKLWPGTVLRTATDGELPLDRPHPHGWYCLNKVIAERFADVSLNDLSLI